MLRTGVGRKVRFWERGSRKWLKRETRGVKRVGGSDSPPLPFPPCTPRPRRAVRARVLHFSTYAAFSVQPASAPLSRVQDRLGRRVAINLQLYPRQAWHSTDAMPCDSQRPTPTQRPLGRKRRRPARTLGTRTATTTTAGGSSEGL
eukprot:3353787-Rhodomonas_salina.1